MDSTSCKRMADKQREDYMNLLARIPNLFDRFKNVKVNDHVTVSITADPIRKEDEVTTGNTYYVMLKASCTVTDTDEGETNTFHFDVLKIPIYTNMGYHIRNLDRMILDVNEQANGWMFISKYSKEVLKLLDDESEPDVMSSAKLISSTFGRLSILYSKKYGMVLAFGRTGVKVPISVFLIAISNYTADELLSILGNDNLYILDSFTSKLNSYNFSTTSEVKTIDKGYVPSRNDYVEKLYECYNYEKDNSSKTVFLPVDAKLRELNAYLFSEGTGIMFNSTYAKRLERTQSFSYRAYKKTLASDIVLDGKIYGYKGKSLSEEELTVIDNLPITEISVEFHGDMYTLRKYSTFTFRALGYKLWKEVSVDHNGEVVVFKKGHTLSLEDLQILNDSSLDTIVVVKQGEAVNGKLQSASKPITIKRRVRPTTLDFNDLLTVTKIAADNMNHFDTFDSEYELNNRSTLTFEKMVSGAIETTIVKLMDRMKGFLYNLDEEPIYTRINSLRNLIDTDAVIKMVCKSDAKESRLIEINNPIHLASMSRKVIHNVAANNVSDSMRAVQNLQYGRIDSVDSPESGKIGLVHSRTLMSEVDNDGNILTPYFPVKDCVVGENPVYISAQDEINCYIAEWDETFYEQAAEDSFTEDPSVDSEGFRLDSNGNRILKDKVDARLNGEIVSVDPHLINYKGYTPLQNMSLAHSLIPFVGHDSLKRVLMGCNHQKQAIPTLDPHRPGSGTGMENALDIGVYRAGKILEEWYSENVISDPSLVPYKDSVIDSSLVILADETRTEEDYRLLYFSIEALKEAYTAGKIETEPKLQLRIVDKRKTYDNSIFTSRLNPNAKRLSDGSWQYGVYHGDDIVAHDMGYDRRTYEVTKYGDYGGVKIDEGSLNTGSLALGHDLVTAIKTWGSSTIDDAITLGSDMVFDETLTSITIIKKEVVLTKTEQPHRRDLLCCPTERFDILSEEGLPRIGAILKKDDPYICLCTEKVNNSSGALEVTPAKYRYLDGFREGQVTSVRRFTKSDSSGESKDVIEIYIASRSPIEVGDKLSGRHGNKGVIARVVPSEQLPYDPVTGRKVDIIINPLGLPSRMNLAVILEGIASYAMHLDSDDRVCVCAPYAKGDLDFVKGLREKYNIHPVMLCDGRTGNMFKRPINVTCLYFMKLVHVVANKIHSVGLDCPTDAIFNQPLKGAKHDGGQTIGEMEVWSFMAVGAYKVLQSLFSTQSDDLAHRKANKDQLFSKLNDFTAEEGGDNRNDYATLTFMRSLGIDILVDPETKETQFVPFTTERIMEISSGEVVDETDLHKKYNVKVNYSSDNAKNSFENNDRTKVARKGIWKVIDLKQPIVNPMWTNQGYLDKFIIACELVRDIKGTRVKGKLTVQRKKACPLKQGALLNIIKGTYGIFMDKNKDGYYCYGASADLMPESSYLTGNAAILYLFRNYDLHTTLSFYEKEAEKAREKIDKNEDLENAADVADAQGKYTEALMNALKFARSVQRLLEAGFTLESFLMQYLPVMPEPFRPLSGKVRANTDSDFDKGYKDILSCVNNSDPDISSLYRCVEALFGLSNFLTKSEKNNSNRRTRVNIMGYWKGTGNKSAQKNKGRIIEKVMSKRIMCSGRSTITPNADMLCTQIGIPISMCITTLQVPLKGYLIKEFFSESKDSSDGRELNIHKQAWKQLFSSLINQDRTRFNRVYKEHFAAKCKYVSPEDLTSHDGEYDDSSDNRIPIKADMYAFIMNCVIHFIEGDSDYSESKEQGDELPPQVALCGRQPTLHQFGIRAFTVKVVFDKTIQLHPLVCSAYNADFDGDSAWLAFLLDKEAKKEALEKMSPKNIFYNPKDSSLILSPSQDIILGCYCGTMLKNNAQSIYEYPESLDNIMIYNDIDQLRIDVEYGHLEYYNLVIFDVEDPYVGVNDDGSFYSIVQEKEFADKHSAVRHLHRRYFSTAGRILFNSIVPDGFMEDRKFTNPLDLPIPTGMGFSETTLYDLKYDGLIAKSGQRSNTVYYRMKDICKDIIESEMAEGRDDSSAIIEKYQQIVDFGLHSADIHGITLSLDEMEVQIYPDEINARTDRSVKCLEDAASLDFKGHASFSMKAPFISESVRDGYIETFRSNQRAALANLDVAAIAASGGEVKEVKDYIIATTSIAQEEVEYDYAHGLMSANGRKAAVATIYNTAKENIKNAIPEAMDRNNSFFIIYDSGARGDSNNIMQTAGAIGILQKTKTSDMEVPVLTNYIKGLSDFETRIAENSARIGVASTQNETRNAGHNTRTTVYMTSGMSIVSNDCGKTEDEYWYDTEWEPLKSISELETGLCPSVQFFEKYLLGKKVDQASVAFFGDTLDSNGCITKQSFRSLRDGFFEIRLVGEEPIEASNYLLDSLLDVSEECAAINPYNKYLKGSLADGKITPDSLSIICEKVLKVISTNRGDFFFRFKYSKLSRSIMVHRLCADTVVNTVEIVKRNSLQLSLGSAGEYASLFEKDYFDASKQVIDLTDTFSDAENPNEKEELFNHLFDEYQQGNKVYSVTTEETVNLLEECMIERAPIRMLLDCHEHHGVCAKCFGRKFTKPEFPLIGANLGIESAQAVGEVATQLTLNLINTGGAAGKSVQSGVEILQSIFSGSKPGGSDFDAKTSPVSGYASVERIDSNALLNICSDPNDVNSSMAGFRLPYDSISVKNGEYVPAGSAITYGYVMPQSVAQIELPFYYTEKTPPKGDEALLNDMRGRQIIWLDTYHKVFVDNGIDINARHLELFVRLQLVDMVILEDNPKYPNLHAGESYEFGEILKEVRCAEGSLADLQYKQLLLKKYDVVMDKSGGLASMTFESPNETLAKLVLNHKVTKNSSPLCDLSIGTNLTTGKLQQFVSKVSTESKENIVSPIKSAEQFDRYERYRRLTQEEKDQAEDAADLLDELDASDWSFGESINLDETPMAEESNAFISLGEEPSDSMEVPFEEASGLLMEETTLEEDTPFEEAPFEEAPATSIDGAKKVFAFDSRAELDSPETESELYSSEDSLESEFESLEPELESEPIPDPAQDSFSDSYSTNGEHYSVEPQSSGGIRAEAVNAFGGADYGDDSLDDEYDSENYDDGMDYGEDPLDSEEDEYSDFMVDDERHLRYIVDADTNNVQYYSYSYPVELDFAPDYDTSHLFIAYDNSGRVMAYYDDVNHVYTVQYWEDSPEYQSADDIYYNFAESSYYGLYEGEWYLIYPFS